ncbi:MAG: hypothetical protein A2156_01605 [Deltaproteobacteria bacterium RBG_16_48_10]|nr:MAG: hypothetical protein A2156_01605 [Deltaproteobacteria bacterium RBG_16_48_10]
MKLYAESSAVLAWFLPFPREPIRTMDALHLASALLLRSAISGLTMLSLDERIRTNALELGFAVLPE